MRHLRTGSPTAAAIAWLAAGFVALLAAPAWAQLSIGSTTGLLPSAPLYRSLILGDDHSRLQGEWQSPVNATQQAWVGSINSRANQSTSGAVPATFNTAIGDSSIAQAAALRYAMTGSSADLNKAVGALQLLAIPANNSNDFITHPEVLTNYLLAYDMIRGASLSDLPQATRNTIESRLLARANGLNNGNGTESNARAKIGATRALAGELLGNQQLLDRGLSDLQANFNYSTTDDGWYADSQGHYLNYIIRNVAPFLRAYQQGSGVDLYSNVQPLFDFSQGVRLPSGVAPNVANGLNYPVAMNLFTSTGDATAAGHMLWYMNHATPSPYPWTNTNVLNNDGAYTNFFALTDFSTAEIAPQASPTYFSPGQAQATVFRQDWGPTSDYLMLSPGVDPPAFFLETPVGTFPLPAFHSHGDTLEILLAAKGEYLLVAPGYQRNDLSNSPPSLDTQSPESHNVILVDGGLGDFSQGSWMRPEDFVAGNRLDSAELGGFKGVSDFSTVHTNYADTDVARSIAFPGEDYFVVFDRMQSATAHSYGFNLIGRGAQTVLADQPDAIDVRWEHNGAQATEHLFSTHGMSLATGAEWMHDTFNQFEQTQRMTASITANDAMFMSVLETGAAGGSSSLVIDKLISGAELLGLRVTSATGGWQDTLFGQHSSTPQTVGDLTSDAQYAYIREENGLLTRAMLADGTLLNVDGQAVVALDHASTLSLLFGDRRVDGTISADGLSSGTELKFFDRGQIVSAFLNGAPITFANGAGWAGVFLPAGGSLTVTFVPEPGAWLLAAVGAATGIALLSNRRRRA